MDFLCCVCRNNPVAGETGVDAICCECLAPENLGSTTPRCPSGQHPRGACRCDGAYVDSCD